MPLPPFVLVPPAYFVSREEGYEAAIGYQAVAEAFVAWTDSEDEMPGRPGGWSVRVRLSGKRTVSLTVENDGHGTWLAREIMRLAFKAQCR